MWLIWDDAPGDKNSGVGKSERLHFLIVRNGDRFSCEHLCASRSRSPMSYIALQCTIATGWLNGIGATNTLTRILVRAGLIWLKPGAPSATRSTVKPPRARPAEFGNGPLQAKRYD